MPGGSMLLFFGASAIIIAVIVALWRYWDAVSHRTPEEEAFDRRLSALNERQSNRMSDNFIRADIDQDTAWQIMVERGRRAERGRDRYADDMERPARERPAEGRGQRRPRR